MEGWSIGRSWFFSDFSPCSVFTNTSRVPTFTIRNILKLGKEMSGSYISLVSKNCFQPLCKFIPFFPIIRDPPCADLSEYIWRLCLSCLQSWVLSPLKAKSTQPHEAMLEKSEGKGEGTDEAMSEKS